MLMVAQRPCSERLRIADQTAKESSNGRGRCSRIAGLRSTT